MIRYRTRKLRWSGAALRPLHGDFNKELRWVPCTPLSPVCLGRSHRDQCTCPPRPDRHNRIRIRDLLRENLRLKRDNELLASEMRRSR